MHIITINREFGSGGRELGKRLAEALGYAYYDREILTMLAERTDLDEAYLAHTLEESAPSALFPITIGQTFSVLPNYQAEYSTQLLQKQTALIKELATKSDCVIVGRNADIILREQDPLRLLCTRIWRRGSRAAVAARCREKISRTKNMRKRSARWTKTAQKPTGSSPRTTGATAAATISASTRRM